MRRAETQAVTGSRSQGSTRGEVRVLRIVAGVGLLVTLALAALYALLPMTRADVPALLPAAACAALALVFLLLISAPRLLGFADMLVLALLSTGVAAGVLAWASGGGVGSVGLAFVPLLIGAAAVRIDARITVVLALTHACLLMMLGALERQGAFGAQRTGAALAEALGMQLALLVAAVTIGTVTQRAFAHTLDGLRQREQRFLGLLAVAADWYWETDAELRFTHLSEHAAGGSGIDVDRRLGKAPWEIENFGLDADAMDAHRADLEARQPFNGLIVRRVTLDGQARWLSVTGRPRFDARGVFIGYWGVGRDITAEHGAELQRSATESRYRELFARSPSPLVLHRDGNVIDANVAALSLFGAWSPNELIGKPLLDFYDEVDGSRDLAARRAQWFTGIAVGEATPPQQFGVRTTNGRLLTVVATSVKVDTEGGPAILSIYRDETERLRSEHARQRSEALLAHVVATSPDLITLTDITTGRYVMVNDAFVKLAGYSREEVIGRTSLELNIWGSTQAREHFVDLLRSQGEVRDLPITFLDRAGSEFSLLVSAARFAMEGREYLVLNGRDVTQAERDRLEREAILANASIGIAVTRDRSFQLANPKFEQMFGWPAGTLVGQPGHVTSVDEADYTELGRQYGPALARGEAVELERRMKRRDGSSFLCRLLARPIDPTHPAKGATIWIAEDVTETRAVAEALARARDDAEAANRAKSAFLANTSHEIRTPLNGLVGLARLARQPGLDEARRAQYLAQIDDSAQALSGVISDILDLSKIEAGKLRLEQSEFDLHVLLESIEHGYSALADARALELAMDVTPGVPRRVRGDPMRLRQVLSNFLSNALKFTDTGVVRLRVEAVAGDRIRFEVEDTGPGIAPEVQGHLFEPFTQADVSTTRRFGGTGLGLSICRQLAELMGGEVGLSSAPGQGSRFWAELPLPTVGEPAASEGFASLGPVTREGSVLTGLKLLIVEDNPVNMMIAVALLQQWGIEVAEAGNGVDATRLVIEHDAGGRPFDIVLMDVQMPVQGGHDATRVLRQRFGADTLPVIALTAAALTSEREEALACGMNDFLTKPIDAQRLYDTLQRWARPRATVA
jgi:PAS domain S-box-containing protein